MTSDSYNKMCSLVESSPEVSGHEHHLLDAIHQRLTQSV